MLSKTLIVCDQNPGSKEDLAGPAQSLLESHQLDPMTKLRSPHIFDIQTPSKFTLVFESSKVGFQDPLSEACHLRTDRSVADFVAVFDRLAQVTC